MGSIYKGVFQRKWLPQLSLIRNKHKHNITKPRLPHFERLLVEHVCTPYFAIKKKPQHIPDINACTGDTIEPKKDLMEPLLDILANEAFDKIKSSKLIAFFHLNTINADEIFNFRIQLKNNGMKFAYYKKKVMVRALTGTEYEPVLHLYKGPTVMATTEELQLPKLLKISKKIRKIILMAALFENRLLSYSEIKYYGLYENIDAARVKLIHTLNSPSENVFRQINQHPNTLVWCLNQNIDCLKKQNPVS